MKAHINIFNLLQLNQNTSTLRPENFSLQNRRLVDFRNEYNLTIFREDYTNGLQTNDSFLIYLVERLDWVNPNRWNWRELSRFKRTSGIIMPTTLYDMLITDNNISKSKFAVTILKQNKVYWTPISQMEKFTKDVGMIFFEEMGGNLKKMIGFPRDLFEEVPMT